MFAGCGAIVTDAQYDGTLGTLGIATTFALIIMVMVYATGHLSGAHINPARSLGPALVSSEWSDIWVYIAGPVCGAVLGAIAYQFVRGGQDEAHANS